MMLLLRAYVLGLPIVLSQFAVAQEIFVCVDSKGRKLTADRPIAECLDREQKVMGPGGTVKRVLGPSLTQQERSIIEDAQRREAEEHAQLTEDRRRDRALLVRYPNQAAHDRERAEAFIQLDEGMRASRLRLQELSQQRTALDQEMEFYRKDPSKGPAALKRRIDENVLNIAAQQRYLTDQDEEKKRVNQRFDEELIKLAPRWGAQAATPARASSASSASNPK
ncbi:MAG: DUF4124 domain-containing protein [Betaproteobacteria bacterium]